MSTGVASTTFASASSLTTPTTAITLPPSTTIATPAAATATAMTTTKAELPLVLYGIPLGGLPRRVRVLIGVLGTLGVYIVHGYLQEWLFSEPGFVYSLFVTLMQFLMFATFSRIDIAYQRWTRRRVARADGGNVSMLRASAAQYAVPPYVYGVMGTMLVLAFGLSNMSMLYLTYPMKTVLKASKLIPTMALGLVVQQRRYSSRDYVSALALIVGVVLFTLGDHSVNNKASSSLLSSSSSALASSSTTSSPLDATTPTPLSPSSALASLLTSLADYDSNDGSEGNIESEKRHAVTADNELRSTNVAYDSLHWYARRKNVNSDDDNDNNNDSAVVVVAVREGNGAKDNDTDVVVGTDNDDDDDDDDDERWQKSPNGIAIGCFLMLGSLLSDSLLGNLQVSTV
jgi:hypothetical protein